MIAAKRVSQRMHKVEQILCVCLVLLTAGALGQRPQPLVAIHDSELTRALETLPASGQTPTGPGTTGFQWWPTKWHYFVMPESLKEALRSDGTPFAVVGDADIAAGALLTTNGAPRYPILFSLASEAIGNNEIAQLTNYVAAGGFLFVGSSAFTRNPDGSGRGDFALANQMGIHSRSGSLANWGTNSTFTKQMDHRLTSHIPGGTLTWRMPGSAEEISWGTSPSHVYLAPHDLWRVAASGATVLACGNKFPYLLVKPYGRGYFIYEAAFQPLLGHGGWAPGMYAYVVLRRAIEWAFETANLPVARLSPWPYPYDAAFIVRHDLENLTNEIAGIEASARVEHMNGIRGDYYFCTGTLREDVAGVYDTNAIIASLRRAVADYGASIGPHNGGLKNPSNPALARGAYDYWHWGPDEALGLMPANYSSGKAYAQASLARSFADVEGWLGSLTNGLRSWVGCYFNATREDSYDLQAQLGVNVAGDQKLTPFPHWTLSTRTPGKRYGVLSESVSDWYVNGAVAQSLEPWRAPGIHTSSTLHAAVNFYYKLGALLNFYSHTLSTGFGDAGYLEADYIRYCMNTNLHPRMWSANAADVYGWWLKRSKAQVAVGCMTKGTESITTFSIAGATDANTTVEALLPRSTLRFQVWTNGVQCAGNRYRANGWLVKIQVGNSVTNAQIRSWGRPSAQNDWCAAGKPPRARNAREAGR